MEPFYLLNKKIQKVIHEMGWENFRPIQDLAISHMINTPSDMIISAPTASGKTEAAFLPIISQIADNGRDSVKTLYISPLKALINDQFLRIESLCKHIDFPITKWHGDGSQSKKSRLVKNPAGILLITPESIESLFLNKTTYIGAMFSHLEYIVIDEIHSFIGNERGTQLKSLINRLEHTVNIHPYKIALSATISNPSDIAKWLNFTNPDSVKIIIDDEGPKETRGLIKCLYKPTISDEPTTDTADKLSYDLFKIIKNSKNLIFANSKGTLEQYCVQMQDIAKKTGYKNIFYIHHGSLSKNIREQCESLLKSENDISVFCTNTLELGIDIGDIDRIVFLDPPFSVSSMIQRLGRSGRKENSIRKFRFFIEELKIDDQSSWQDKFRTKLIQSIALVELMLEGFSEPLNTEVLDYSTFVHQLISYLGQTGGTSLTKLFHNIAEIAFNGYFSKTDFLAVAKNLESKNIIYQSDGGITSLTPLGEKIVDNYEFYAAFQTPEEWTVIYDGQEIGQIPSINIATLTEGDNFILASKKWKVIELNDKGKKIIVTKSKEEKFIRFFGSGQNIHRAVHQKMLTIYTNQFIPKYLSSDSISILEEGLENYKTYIESSHSNILVVLEGSRIQRTIKLLLEYISFDFEEAGIGFLSNKGKKDLIRALKAINFDTLNIFDVANQVKRIFKEMKKFDYLLPDDILNKTYIQQYLDLEGAKRFIEKL